ncbi:MAG TPA: ferredoxin [Bacteroidota bacterium]|jgi:ferredoxin
MDQPGNRLPKNVEGKYYTTDDCNGCAYCASVAPDNFDFDKPSNSYYVSKQPGDPNEEELVDEALSDCPIDAIQIEGNKVLSTEEE